MTIASSARRPLLLALVLGSVLALAAPAARAQTPDSAAGTGPSQALSTPPNASPINRPGAMRHAYARRSKTPPRHPATPSAPPPQATTAPH